MAKLTNWDRENIVRAASAHAFDERFAELAKSADKLAREAYAILIPDAVRKQALKLPDGIENVPEMVAVLSGLASDAACVAQALALCLSQQRINELLDAKLAARAKEAE